MRKFLTILSVGVLSLFVLSCFSYMVTLANDNHKALGRFRKPIRAFALFPKTMIKVFTSKEIKGIPPTFIPIADGTSHQDSTINNLDYDLYGLTSYYDMNENLWRVQLFNFRTDSTLHEWKYVAQNFTEDAVYNFDDSKPKHSLLFKDKSIVMSLRQTRNLTKIDANSEVIWTNEDFIFHHSLNFDQDSSIWVCSTVDSPKRSDAHPLNFAIEDVDGQSLLYRDDQITKIDHKTGETLYRKSLSEIFIKNGLISLLLGMETGVDPIHLNDIQPVWEDGTYWKKGDLLLSMRNRSIVMHYRPSTDEVIKLIQGPLLHQHDVDFYSDHELSIFNNNWADMGIRQTGKMKKYDIRFPSSEIVVYDYETDSYRSVYQKIMNDHRLYTPTAGIHTFLSNGDLFLDLEDVGRILIVDQEKVKYRRIFPTPIEGYKHLTNWTRVFEKLEFNH